MTVHRSFRQVAFAACGLLFSAVATAHPDDGSADDAFAAAVFDCEHPPADAMDKLPAPLDGWARIECTPAGQKLVAGGEWYWRYPASWTTRPEAPAWAPDASIRTRGPKHFVSMQVDTLDAAAIAATHERLMRESATYKFQIDEQPGAMYRVGVTNNLGHTMDIYVPVVSEKRMWAILCVPVCRPEYAFMIERR